MRLTFHRTDDRLWSRDRDVTAVPRVGDAVVWHGLSCDSSDRFVVTDVLHAYEDRPWYAERQEEFGDRIHVTLEPCV